jgi:hypothetical protein
VPAWWSEHVEGGQRFHNAGPGVWEPGEKALAAMKRRFAAISATREPSEMTHISAHIPGALRGFIAKLEGGEQDDLPF